MKKLLILVAALAFATTATAQTLATESGADEVIRYWDNSTAPHSNCDSKAEKIVSSSGKYKVSHTTETVFYIFKPQRATGHSLVIFPGGGYKTVNLNFGWAKWLAAQGITTMVVKYRLPNGHAEVPLEDAAAAIEYMRDNADRLGIDPQKVGVSGSSAGGHLAAWSSVVLKGNQKPNFAVLHYPVISGHIWTNKPQWSTFEELLGKWRTPEQIDNHSVELLVDGNTPPTLILHCHDDLLAPTINSTLYYKALKHHGVKASYHIYPSGGHSWNEYKKQWTEATKEWVLSF